MSYRVELLPAARRDSKRPSKPVQTRIVDALRELADDSRSPGATKLAGDDLAWRIRVGQYRVLYEIHDKRLLVLVVRMGDRKDIYRKGR